MSVEETEVWLPVDGYEGRYEVSSLGCVRSVPRTEFTKAGHRRTVKGGILAPQKNHDGYLMVGIILNGRRKFSSIHRLVCKAFHGPPTLLHNEAAHLDGDRANARADNLKWVSKIENHSHRRLHGTHGAGEKHPRAKLTNSDVMLALELLAIGHTCKQVGARLGVSGSAIEDIKKRKNWRHLVGPRKAYTPRSTGSGQHGTDNHFAKLTMAQAEEIRRRGLAGEPCRALGKEFGVGHAAANRIIRGVSYRPRPRDGVVPIRKS